jgi:hypothetical protein
MLDILKSTSISKCLDKKCACFLNYLSKHSSFILEDEQGNTLYNGYDISYIMIRYIIETLGKDYLLTLMKNKKQIQLVEQTTLTDAIEYFNCQYLEENSIKTPNL